jgi:hypothetical protein
LEQTISRAAEFGNRGSSSLVTAPGKLSKYAGQPHEDLNLWFARYSGVPHPAQWYVPVAG